MAGDLLITSYVPARTSGRGQRTCSVIAALARLQPVEVAYVPFGGDSPAPELEADANVTLRRIDPSRGPARLACALLATSRGATWDFARAVSPEVVAAVRRAPPGVRLIADGPTAAAAVLPFRRRREAVYVAHNLESSFRGTPALRRFEGRVLASFRESWMATHADMRAAAELTGRDDLPLRHVPNVVDARAFPVRPERPAGHALLFVADFTYAPNREGLSYLLGEVMPELWADLPGATLTVVGRGLDEPAPDERVRFAGFVDDLGAAYAEADVAVVPLLHGGGSPLKFVEALAFGLPVVASAHAAALIEQGRSGEHFLAAEDAAGLAAALRGVLHGEHPGLGARGRALAEAHFSVEALARELAEGS